MFTKTKSILASFFIIVFFFSFLSCDKNKNPAQNSNNHDDFQKPVLEVAFSREVEYVPLSYLVSVIGTGSGESETFGEKKSMMIFFEEEGCSTCEKVKPAVNDWVRLAACTVYAYKEDKNSGTAEEKREFLKKLGSEDGIELTAGRLIAFTEGVRRGALSGTFDLESARNVDIFARRYFVFPEKESFKNEERYKLSGLKELRKMVSAGKDFLLYTERHSCPYCRLLSDPQGYDSLTQIMKNSTVPLVKVTSEDTLRELYSPVQVDGKAYESSFAYLAASGSDKILWPENDNEKKKAEYLEMLVALKFIPPHADDDGLFLKAVDAYAADLSLNPDGKFLWSDRLVPSFCLYREKKTAVTELEMKFPFYFAADNEKIAKDEYNKMLINWVKTYF